jgi:hypothetical protein
MSSRERVYSLLVQANPIPDPQVVPPVPSPALLDERRSEMLTQEPTATEQIAQKPRWPRAIVAFAATIVIVAAAVGIWALTNDPGPVAAGDAQIEVTFTGDAVDYAGDSEIYPGRAELEFTNDWTAQAWIIVHRFDTGSAELAAELARAPMGVVFETTDGPPGDVILMEEILPELGSFSGSVTRPITIEAGSSYLLTVAVSGDDSTQVWMTALIEGVAAD